MQALSKQLPPVPSRAMKGLTTVLFLFGCFWALWAFFLLLMPLGIFQPKYQYRTNDVIFSLVGSATSAVGYFVWFGWLFFALKGRFPLVQWRPFWLVSLLQHSAWFFILPYMRDESIAHFIGSSEILPVKLWIFGNMLIASFCLLAQGASPDAGCEDAMNRPLQEPKG